MYQIDRTDFGLKMTFSDFITAEEMKEWLKEAETVLLSVEKPFGVIVDMRTLKPLQSDAQIHMEAGQKLFREKGMIRSAVILNDLITTMQFQRLARQTGIYKWERYINTHTTPDWEGQALEWVKNGNDPDETVNSLT